MEKKMNNKGFSLVELIIVVAIMAVLIGVLAPTYLKYVENSKKTADCSAIGSMLDACEVTAIDPSVDWATSETITITESNGTLTITSSAGNTSASEALAAIEVVLGGLTADLEGAWAQVGYKIVASKDTDGNVEFKVTTNTAAVAEITKANAALGKRLTE